MKLSKSKVILTILIIFALTVISLLSYEFINHIGIYKNISNKSLYFSLYKMKQNGEDIKNTIESFKNKDSIKNIELLNIYNSLSVMKSELYILFHQAENKGLSYEEYKEFTYFDSILSKSKENDHLVLLDENLKRQLDHIYNFVVGSGKTLETIPDEPIKNNYWIYLYQDIHAKYKHLLTSLSS